MIIRMYIFFLFVIITIGILAYKRKSRETYLRVISFFGILNLVSVCYILGNYAFFVLVSALLGFAMYELCINYKNRHPIIFASVILTAYLAISYYRDYIICLVPMYIIIVIITFISDENTIKSNVFSYIFGVLVLAVSGASLFVLFEMNRDNVIVLIFLLVFNDVTGYFVGRKFGKIQIFKVLSPKKTLEGYVGCLIGLFIGIILLNSLVPILRGTSIMHNIILIIFFFILGNAGDLLFSKIKRSLKVKDFSSLLPGHGGILDRFDSVLFVAPLLYVLLVNYMK